MKRLIWLLSLLLTLAPIMSHADVAVPDWFQSNSARPYAIFDAWKHLSSRAAAVYCGADGKVLGGILVDATGHPLPQTNVSVVWLGASGINIGVRTDDKGCFLIYSPVTMNDGHFYASPGYPATVPGWSYAGSKREIKKCSMRVIYQQPDRAFMVVTVETASTFTAAGFLAFQRSRALDAAADEQIMPGLSHMTTSDDNKPQTITTFPIRVVSPQGQPIAHAIVGFRSGELSRDRAETDADGRAWLIEHLLTGQPASYYRWASRRRKVVSIYAPGYSDGPVKCELKAGVLTTLVPGPQAQVQGRVLDPDGFPDLTDVMVCYPSNDAGSLARTRPDGTFTISGVRPGRTYKVAVNIGNVIIGQPTIPVQTAYMTALKPGEVKTGIVIHEVRPAALRGILLDSNGRPVPVGQSARGANRADLSLIFEKDNRLPETINYNGSGACLECWTDGLIYEGTGGWFWGDPGNLFGFGGLGTGPFRLRVTSSSYQPYLSEPIQLEPGELRFVKIFIQPKPQTFP